MFAPAAASLICFNTAAVAAAALLQLVREASKRVLGLRPFDVQLIGGMILHEGQVRAGLAWLAPIVMSLHAAVGVGVRLPAAAAPSCSS